MITERRKRKEETIKKTKQKMVKQLSFKTASLLILVGSKHITNAKAIQPRQGIVTRDSSIEPSFTLEVSGDALSKSFSEGIIGVDFSFVTFFW